MKTKEKMNELAGDHHASSAPLGGKSEPTARERDCYDEYFIIEGGARVMERLEKSGAMECIASEALESAFFAGLEYGRRLAESEGRNDRSDPPNANCGAAAGSDTENN